MRSTVATAISLAVVASLGISPLSLAQETSAQSIATAGLGEDSVDGTVIRSALEVGATFTDNFFYTGFFSPGDEPEEVDGTGYLVKPGLAVIRAMPRARLSAEISGEAAGFDVPDDVDDYFDARLALGAEWVSSPRNSWRASSRLRYDHDAFGTDRTEGTPLETRELDEWREIFGTLGYRYGLPTDRMNVDVSVTALNKTYTTNEADTQFLDHESALAQLSAYYNMTAKTSVYGSVSGERVTYEEVNAGAIDRGATELRYGLGALWKASAKTSGNLYVGHVNRRPRDDRRDDFSGFDWIASANWSPRSYRTFELQTGRLTQESYLRSADFINNRFAALSWSEQWGSRLNTKLSTRYADSEFVGIDRNDDTLSYALDAEYLLSRYLKLLATASSTSRDTDLVTLSDYDRFYGYIGVRFAR